MADRSQIDWTDATFNPWLGCTKVSPACDHCYAEAWAKRSGLVQWGNNPRRATSDAYWKQPHRWNREARAAGVRRRVFCASLADVFDNQVDPAWRRELWDLIHQCDALDWLLLTKRPQNIAAMLPGGGDDPLNGIDRYATPWPWPHVWLGTTVENQEEADRRIPHLLAVPARLRFLSCEPLLGPVDLREYICHPASDWMISPELALYWVIAGGESGPGARPMRPDWARSLRDQCQAAGVPFFFKQWGEWIVGDDISIEIRVGKKAAGRELDGREHNEFPS